MCSDARYICTHAFSMVPLAVDLFRGHRCLPVLRYNVCNVVYTWCMWLPLYLIACSPDQVASGSIELPIVKARCDTQLRMAFLTPFECKVSKMPPRAQHDLKGCLRLMLLPALPSARASVAP